MATHRFVYRFVPSEVEAALGHRYILGTELGTGGQGTVYRARRRARADGSLANDDVALKLHLYTSEKSRVEREIGATADVSHPNLARLLEFGFCDIGDRHTPYLAWDFIEGRPLGIHLNNGPLLESEVLAIGRDICKAIAEIWSKHIVHGDIKPSNVMLRSSSGYIMTGSVMQAVLIDLGAATYLDLDIERSLRPRHLEPGSGSPTHESMGTRGYFSPEQYSGIRTLTCASDIFSLGVVLTQCLIGRHPTNRDQDALAKGIRASKLKPSASRGLRHALDEMLQQHPASRPQPAELSRRFETLRMTIVSDMGQRP